MTKYGEYLSGAHCWRRGIRRVCVAHPDDRFPRPHKISTESDGVLLPLTGVWRLPGIAGAAELAVKTVTACIYDVCACSASAGTSTHTPVHVPKLLHSCVTVYAHAYAHTSYLYTCPCNLHVCFYAHVSAHVYANGHVRAKGKPGQVNADKTVFTPMKARPMLNYRCNKKANTNLKACDKGGDGGVNGTQGFCSLDQCKAICRAHTGFKCRYVLRQNISL